MFVDKKKKAEVEIPTGPMADVSFLLLIFFLVTTTLHSDKGLMMALPPWGDVKEIPKQNISHILVNADGLIMFDQEVTPLAAVRERVRAKTSANPYLLISIKTDNETSYERYIDVLDQVKLGFVGDPKISIAEPET